MAGHTNGVSVRRIPLRHGIYSPTMTFFDPETEDIDIPTIKKHAIRLAKAGLVGLVTMGSNGEAVHLSREEKTAVTKATREALDEAGFSHIPVITGASENSIRGTLELIRECAAAGASYVLLVPPSYYRYAMDNDRLEEYFIGVADSTLLPIILYNYPGAVAGIDMDSDFLIGLAKHKNIVGTKFTCGNTGKLTRVAQATNAVTTASEGSGYMAFGGMADFTLQTGISGGSGIIAGGANVFPRLCVKKLLSKWDWVLTKLAIPGTKQAIQLAEGYGGYPRKPLRRMTKEEVKTMHDKIEEGLKVESKLPDYGKASS